MLGTITLTVEQQEPASVTLDEEPAENMVVVHNDTTPTEAAKENGHDETPEATPTTPESEEKAKSPDQADGNQTNEVGFKKVFKFVGLKFTVKKDKSEKSDPVQLLTVKKDEVEVNGTDGHDEQTDIRDDGKKESQQETKDSEQPAENAEEPEQAGENPKEIPEENQKKAEESEVEKKFPESPTNPVVTDTSSPFRRFFTQGWAGLRKRTSFKKSKEEDPQEVEKHIKAEEQEKVEVPEVPETVKEESATETQPAADLSVTQDLSKSSSEQPKVSTDENIQNMAEEKSIEELSPIKEVEVKLEECVKVVEEVTPVTENAEKTSETVTSASEETPVPDVKSEVHILKDDAESQITNGITVASISTAAEGISEDLQGTTDTVDVDNDQPQLASSTESVEQEKSQEAITTEAELLSSQEKAKIQGSPLKKLFSSSGLRKLSGKKSKSKKEDDSKVEVATEAVSPESPEALEIDGGDSSPSSPDESAETSPIEKPLDEPQYAAEAEGEGTTSDGERKKDGITPWASFKKLVTPKRRPKRPSESDKEDEVEKAKTSTMSSTESAGVENVEEPKEINEDQKLEKSTEENKKKVDSSVSWEALICVGSSKKRARKTSDSEEDEGIKSPDEAKKTEDIVPAKDIDSDSPIISSQEQNQESTSPDQAGSPTEADGASTWQSFKRLVTPRRKSRTRVEEKNDETAGSNTEQSTSEGEAGKEETWVSFKKLIPGRKKKKSDGKQEHAATTETGQPLSEAAEDDSDEPAVVPLAEFDAAEQEKLDTQKSLEEALPTVLGEHEELIHAVTVTVIEGERAITNLEERSPSWISATVSETIEHAKEIEEAADIIKTEVTIEETVVLSAVSQVMTQIPNTIINEMELTSEALTALEEAIENSCAEETTEMISAVSQLVGSVVSTGEATPMPEEDASVKTLEDQKKHTENILHEVAEKAKLTLDTLQASQYMTDLHASMDAQEIICKSAPLCVEEETNLSPVSLEEQGDKSTIICVEATVHQIEVQKDINALIDPFLKTEEKCEDASDSLVVENMAQESATALEAACAKDDSLSVEDITVSSEAQAEDVIPKSNEVKLEVAPLSYEVQTEEVVPVSSELQAEEVVPVSKELQAEEGVPMSSELQAEVIVPLSSELHSKEITLLSSEMQPEQAVPVSSELKLDETVPVSNQLQSEEPILVSIELQPEEVVLSVVQSKETVIVSNKVQSEEVIPESSDVQFEKVVSVSNELQPEETVPLLNEVGTDELLSTSIEVQPEEMSSVSNEVKPKESVSVKIEVLVEVEVSASNKLKSEFGSVSTKLKNIEVQKIEENIPVCHDIVDESDVTSASEELKAEEGISVAERCAPAVSVEVQSEECLGVQIEEQVKENVSLSDAKQAEVQAEECVTVSNCVPVGVCAIVFAEAKAEERIPESAEAEAEESDAVSDEMQVEAYAFVLPEAKVEESTSESIKVQDADSAQVSSNVQVAESFTGPADVQTERIVQKLEELQPAEISPVLPVNEIVQVVECISWLDDKKSEMASQVQADQIAPATMEQISDVKSQVSEAQSDITPSLLIRGDAKASTAISEEQKKHPQEEIVEMKEEAVTTDIPELESSEATKAAEPVTAAAVEEQVLTETVKTIEIPKDRVEPSEVTDDDKRFEESERLSRGLQVVAESVSQKAAAIVDAAIEAATNCFVVDASGQSDKLEEMAVSEKVEVTEENTVQIITIESCSATIVHNVVETTVEKVVTNSVQEENLGNELNSQLLQTVLVHETIKLCPQLEESEQGKAEGEQKPGKEIESVVSVHAQETNEISTQASEAHEKAPTLES
ncbi:A-kinase anchor protein 12 isoform X2 [Dendrobates tinctorius]|uniref:A-kinase anchor protein 12 isoform X2 n=1 Tax=Dendrobates tinctorius TaxID=92724 RepID=UPI003CC99F2B